MEVDKRLGEAEVEEAAASELQTELLAANLDEGQSDSLDELRATSQPPTSAASANSVELLPVEQVSLESANEMSVDPPKS